VTCVATDATTGEPLMVAHMNAEALAKTIATARHGISAVRAAACGARVKAPATCNACSKCASIATRMPSGSGRAGGTRRVPHRAPLVLLSRVPLGKAPDASLALEFRAEKAFDPHAVYGDAAKS